MSSILDALKKLESEKSGTGQPAERADIEAVAAERDLTRRRRNQPAGELVRINSLVLILGGLAAVAVLVSVSAVAALVIVRATEGQRMAESSVPVAAPLVQTAPFRPAPVVDTAPAVPAPAPLKPVSSDSAIDDPAAPVLPVESVVPMQESAVWIEPTVDAVAERIAPSPKTTPRRAPVAPEPAPSAQVAPPVEETPIGEVDVATLPVLSESERIRLGLPNMKINIVGLPTKRQPRPSALINFEKVYLGEYIKNTNARLIAVELRGVGIEVGGMRYFMQK